MVSSRWYLGSLKGQLGGAGSYINGTYSGLPGEPSFAFSSSATDV